MQQTLKTESCFRVCASPVELRALQGKRDMILWHVFGYYQCKHAGYCHAPARWHFRASQAAAVYLGICRE